MSAKKNSTTFNTFAPPILFLLFDCRVVFSQLQPIKDINARFGKFYVPNTAHSEPHVAYYGEILKAYIVED